MPPINLVVQESYIMMTNRSWAKIKFLHRLLFKMLVTSCYTEFEFTFFGSRKFVLQDIKQLTSNRFTQEVRSRKFVFKLAKTNQNVRTSFYTVCWHKNFLIFRSTVVRGPWLQDFEMSLVQNLRPDSSLAECFAESYFYPT